MQSPGLARPDVVTSLVAEFERSQQEHVTEFRRLKRELTHMKNKAEVSRSSSGLVDSASLAKALEARRNNQTITT